MSAEALAWLNAKFLEKVLDYSENNESCKLQSFKKESAVEIGNNHAADLIRATVKYIHSKSNQKAIEKSLIIKISPITDGLQKEMVMKIEAFDTEIRMFNSTLVKMNRILNEESYRFNPDVLYTEMADPSILVMEDLATLGYRMADRRKGLDLQHCILVMRGLAKFHATSVALSEKDPESVITYKRGMFHNDNPNQLKKFFGDSMRILAYEISNWTELGSSACSFSEKLLKLSKLCYEKAAECCKLKENEFNVLNHGDLWINNILFRYDDGGKVIGHIFVDFQMCVWGSPAVDILRFLNTSISDYVDLRHRSTLLEEYINNLTETMSRLRCTTKPPSITTLEEILMRHELLAVLSSITGLRFLLASKNDNKTSDNTHQQNDNDIHSIHKKRVFREIILRRLSRWNTQGLINV